MAVYIDDEQIPWRGKVWCHMVADTPEELHSFAQRLGLRRSWFQEESRYPHYDLTLSMRVKALGLGAIDADRAAILACAKRMKELIVNPQQASLAFA